MRVPAELQQRFLRVAEEFFNDATVEDRLRRFSGSYSSYESWVNWELFYRFQRRHPTGRYTPLRELAYPRERGNADLAIDDGAQLLNSGDTLRVEAKLVWANSNAAGRIAASVRDITRIAANGWGVFILIAVSAAEPVQRDVRFRVREIAATAWADDIETAIEALLPGQVWGRGQQLFLDEGVQPRGYRLAPRISVRAYRVQPLVEPSPD